MATASSAKKPHQISDATSMLLDIVRFAAAIAVLAAHSGEGTFHTGWVHRQFWGDLAVPVFFVLSGFVIRYVTRTREGNPREYYIDRASRIYSVVLPAMALTLLAVLICYLLKPVIFLQLWGPYLDHPLFRLSGNLLFYSQAWSHNTVPFVDSPFWSLGYECPYYVFYGFLFFMRGWKRILACTILAAALGPQVLFLFPLWWSGVWMYDAYHRLRGKQSARIAAIILALWLAITFVPLWIGRGQSPLSIKALFDAIAALPNPLSLFGIALHRATMFAYAAGVVSAILLFLAILAIDGMHIPWSRFFKHRVRQIADGTFILYLFHYPLMLIAIYAGLFHEDHDLSNLSLLAGIVLLCILLAVPLDNLKRKMRNWLRAVLPA